MTETHLYLYIDEDEPRVYVGIGKSLRRIEQSHNPAAWELRNRPGALVMHTVEPFSTRDDAEKAESIAIRVARALGADALTNISKVDRSKHLVHGDAYREGEVLFEELENTAIVVLDPDSIDDRGSTSGKDDITARAEKYWPLKRANDTGKDVRRLLAIRKGSGRILGDWDVNPDEPFREVEGGWAFNLVNPALDDPRDVKRKRLDRTNTAEPGSFHRLGTLVTYSLDLK